MLYVTAQGICRIGVGGTLGGFVVFGSFFLVWRTDLISFTAFPVALKQPKLVLLY